jgi:hypothetical protein
MMKNQILLSTLLILGMSATANATTTTFFGEDLGLGESTVLAATPNANVAHTNFLAGLINPGIENFESFPDSTSNPAINFAGAGVTATLSGGTVQSTLNGTTNGVGRYGISGDPDSNGRDSYFETSSELTLTFSNPVAAFGFYGIDIGDFNGQVTVTTSGGLNQLFNVGNTLNGNGGSVLFWGLISNTDTFTGITFGNTATGSDFFAFDNFTVGSLEQVAPQVPEPDTYAMMLAGLGLMGFVARRRKDIQA